VCGTRGHRRVDTCLRLTSSTAILRQPWATSPAKSIFDVLPETSQQRVVVEGGGCNGIDGGSDMAKRVAIGGPSGLCVAARRLRVASTSHAITTV
jgi:hypothetical protein